MNVYVEKAEGGNFFLKGKRKYKTWLHKPIEKKENCRLAGGKLICQNNIAKNEKRVFSRSKVCSFACLPDGETNFTFTCYNLSYRSMSSLN